MSLKPFALIAPDACVVTCSYRLHSEIISRSHLLIRQISQFRFDNRGEGVRCLQCGVPVVGLIDRIGHEALGPVSVAVAVPWGVVVGRRLPAHLEPRGSWESGSAHLQLLTQCGMSHRAPESHVGVSLMRLLGLSPTSLGVEIHSISVAG